ncbi:putative transcription factor interactor and regulator CCHC(Zn) family [Helianthus debilis subsp. tardiflorus]
MKGLKITKKNEEWVNKLENALPSDEWKTYLKDLRKIYLGASLNEFIEKIKERDLEIQKISKAEAADDAKLKSEEIGQDVEEQVKEISAIKVEKKTEDVKTTEKCSKCDKFESDNIKLLSDLDSLILENKILKEKANVFENEKSKIEKDFQNQIKILEDERDIFGKNNLEKQIEINSHLAKIIQLEKEAESYRHKIAELESKLKGFVTSAPYVCPEPINSIPISDDVTNFDNVKVEDCDEKSDDVNTKIEKQKLFLELNEKFKNTVLQSTEIGECSKQESVKKIVEQKQKVKNLKIVQNKNKSSSDQSSNRNQKPQKLKNENSKIVGNEWCRFDHSAQEPNPTIRKRKEYHHARQCFDLSVWYENGDRHDNRVCYNCGYQGHIAVNCQRQRFESRRCYNCQIKGHIARDCPRKSSERLRVNSQKLAKKPVTVKPKVLKVSEQHVKEQKVQEPKVQEKKVKLSQGQKDKLRKKRKKAREYLEKILSSGSPDRSKKSADESIHSTTKSSKPNSSDANLRTKEEIKKKEKKVGDESDMSKSDKPPSGDESGSSKSDKPHSGNDSGSSKPEEPVIEEKSENSGLTMDDTNFPPLLNKNSKSPKDSQAWVNLFK